MNIQLSDHFTCAKLLPPVLGLDGIWLSIVVSELAALVLTVFCFVKFRSRYHYT